MNDEPVNTPLLAGVAMAAGFGAVGAAVSWVLLGIGANGAVLIGAVLAAVTGLILALPRAPLPPPNSAAGQPAAAVAALVSPAPAAPPAAAAPPAPAMSQPPALGAARGGQPDDLQQIKGIGPKLQDMLHSIGVYHLDQIAAWTESELSWVDEHLEGFRGRASRDAWVAQAQALTTPQG
jgi:predicted flap endonuclease-1-like 5' DNA nuclease